VDEEEEALLEEEEANTDNTTTNLLTASKITPRPRETHRTPVFNADK